MSKTDLQKKSRTIFLGDIHGCYSELKKLLKKIDYCPTKDRLISLGDLIHKGPKSAKVINYFYKNKIEVIMGNHDWHFYQTLIGNKKMYSEAEEILESLSIKRKKLVQWLESLPVYIEGDDFIAVHGALNPAHKKFYKTPAEEMIFGRYYDSQNQTLLSNTKNKKDDHISPWYEVYPEKLLNGKKVIFGHWAKKEPVIHKTFRGLDTGCCYGGKLSCLILPKDKIVQVKSKQPRMFDY